MGTTVYTHDEKGHRIDVHRPSSINPGDYEYVKVAELRRAKRENEKLAGPGGTCHHCGKAIVWTVYYRYLPTGDLVTFGYQCSEILDMTDNRIDHEMNMLKRRAANERRAERERMDREERKAHFRAKHGDLVKFLEEVDANESFYFLRSLAGSLDQWGSLTDRQTEAAYKIKKSREEYLARKLQEAIENADKPEPDPIEEGRRMVEGTVVSHKWQHSDYYGETHKMLVKQDDDNKVWVTVPESIETAEYEDLKGQRVRFFATVTRSDKDDHFGIAKRPTKGEVL